MTIRASILDTQITFHAQALIQPLRLSSGEIRDLTEARVRVRVRVGLREAVGHGSIYLSHLWAWPESALTHGQRDAAMRRTCEWIATNLRDLCGEEAHPLQMGLRLHENVCEKEHAHAGAPSLALALCASPFDAAIHDAVGQAMGASAFALYREDDPIPAAEAYFTGGVCGAIRRLIRSQPIRHFPAWWIVSGNSIEALVAEGRRRGYRCFKLKLTGRAMEDVDLTRRAYRAMVTGGEQNVQLVGDSNEANPDAASVGVYLEALRAADPAAFAALRYLEQPTSRDIMTHRFDWTPVTRLKPVMLDEGLTALSLLQEAVDQGWSGFALKTCKGHSMALTTAAWANERGIPISLQDLTNPGYAAVHAALFAAHVPTLNGVELNSPQFTPEANRPWLGAWPQLFEPVNGEHVLADASARGLGSGGLR